MLSPVAYSNTVAVRYVYRIFPYGFLSNLDQVLLTLGEFSSSYPTFDDDLKLVAFTVGYGYLSL